MRDYILLYINGTEHRVTGEKAFLPLSDYLRCDLGKCGTKVVCAEGDCGACSVLVGRLPRQDNGGPALQYKPLNGCIQFMHQLDCSHIITVEGVALGDRLSPVQESMVDCHGAQCGYCTPGFIVAMTALFENGTPVSRLSVKDALTGNLCRCTGYESIIRSALTADAALFVPLNNQYPPRKMYDAFLQHHAEPVEIVDGDRQIFLPVTLEGAARYKSREPQAVIVCGGTDVCVNTNKREFHPGTIMGMNNVRDAGALEISGDTVMVGATVTLAELEDRFRLPIPELHQILYIFGSPQIRYAGTLAGNIANASPIADTIPFLYVMEAEVEAVSSRGYRWIDINQFYLGYKKLALKGDELISRIKFKLPKRNELLKLYKVSKREHLDISSFTAAVRLSIDGAEGDDPARPGGTITSAWLAYGGVGPVVLRLPGTEAFLKGKELTLETMREAGRVARDEITPISDVRGSSDYRYQLAENILQKFYHETAGAKELACR